MGSYKYYTHFWLVSDLFLFLSRVYKIFFLYFEQLVDVRLH